MNTFFTGCTHFDHGNIIHLAKRPFKDVEEMNETMIENWNRQIGPKDTVYHLGDFGYCNRERTEHLLHRLNGRKVLIHGNHDDNRVVNARGWFHNTICHEHHLDMVLFHYPIEEWNGFYKGSWHLHAHTHNSDPKGAVHIPKRVNVTVEAWNYTPASLDDILKIWS